MGEQINEVLTVLNELLRYKTVEVIGIDDTDILISCGEYGLTWDIMTKNITIYHIGLVAVVVYYIILYKSL